MRRVDILAGMKATARRKLAGSIVWDELPRHGLNRKTGSAAMHMSPGSLDRIREGATNVRSPRLRSAEKVLDIPRYLLDYIIEGDVTAIEAIGDELDADLRRVILDKLARIDVEGIENDEDNRQAH